MPSRPIAKIHDRFRLQVEALRAAAENLSLSVTGDAQRDWMLLDMGTWSGDPLDVAGITGAFEREAINQHYAEMLSSPNNSGSVGSCISLKMQVDWLAVQERGFRLRHATSVRCAIHAAARRRGHGSSKGVFAGGILTQAQNLYSGG